MDMGKKAGWGKWIARRTHNPKVASSILAPATTGVYMIRVIYSTQMRTGTHWLSDHMWELTRIRKTYVFNEHNTPAEIVTKARKIDCMLFHAHGYDPKPVCEYIANMDDFVCISTTRNYLDMLCSNILYEGRKMQPHFAGMTTDDYIKAVLARSDNEPYIKGLFLQHHMYRRYTHPKYTLVAYEDLHRKPVEVMWKIAGVLKLETTEEQIRDVIKRCTFRRITGREPGVFNGKWDFKHTGVMNSHKRYLSTETIKYLGELYDFMGTVG